MEFHFPAKNLTKSPVVVNTLFFFAFIFTISGVSFILLPAIFIALITGIFLLTGISFLLLAYKTRIEMSRNKTMIFYW